MSRIALILSLSLSACVAQAPKEGDTDVPVDSGEPCEAPDSSWLTVRLSADDALAVGPEDLIWRSETEDGYCVDEDGDLSFRCDVPAGSIALSVNVSGHRLVQQTVEVPAPACDVEMPTLDLPMESLGPFFAEDRGYTIQIIEDDDECARSWELYDMNCFMTAIFCADGDSQIMVTDITWDGLYAVDGDAILGEYEEGEIPADLGFSVVSDTEIVDTAWGMTWTWDPAGEFASYVCREGGA